MTLLFRHQCNDNYEINQALRKGFGGMEIDCWIKDDQVVLTHERPKPKKDYLELGEFFENIWQSGKCIAIDLKDVKALPQIFKEVETYELQDAVFICLTTPFFVKKHPFPNYIGNGYNTTPHQWKDVGVKHYNLPLSFITPSIITQLLVLEMNLWIYDIRTISQHLIALKHKPYGIFTEFSQLGGL